MTKKEMRKNTMKAAGINTGKYFSIQPPEGLKPGATVNVMINEDGMAVLTPNDRKEHCSDDDNQFIKEIYTNGYVKNTKLHRRWVMAQMFRMLNYNYYDGTYYGRGYSACLRDCYPYQYQFTMMLEEIKVLSKLETLDYNAFTERSHFFNKGVVICTCKDYINKLKEYINNLDVKHCKGIPYVRVCNNDIFVDDLEKKIYSPIKKHLNYIINCKNYKEVHSRLRGFIWNMIKLPNNTAKCSEWIDVFKGAGSYYTLMNMVKFHGCFIEDYEYHSGLQLKGIEAVRYLESMLEEYNGEYWRMFALLNKVIEDNDFDFYKRMDDVYNK